jgi:hypothetical protein
MIGKNVAAGELSAFLHQVEDRIFARVTDGGQVSKVNNEFASTALFARTFPSRAKLGNPGSNERSLDYHDALRRCIDNGYLEHRRW